MTRDEALQKKPCSKCQYCGMCSIVDFLYSPCYNQKDDDYHPGFKPKQDQEEEND